MSGEDPKELAVRMNLDPSSIYEIIRRLLLDGLFDVPVPSALVVDRIRERFGRKLSTAYVQTYMRKFMEAGIVHAVKPNKSQSNYYVLTSMSRQDALLRIGKEKRVLEVEQKLFSDALVKKLERNFNVELAELHDNFGRHGNATAFLLRKILEKLLIIVFGKLGRDAQIADKGRPGGWKGLQEVIDVAAKEKVNGLPLLLPKTANAIKGIKFLGDAAAHNPLVGVDVTTIIPQMPFIITAYAELAERL
jgi:predicted transcriptional regulator